MKDFTFVKGRKEVSEASCFLYHRSSMPTNCHDSENFSNPLNSEIAAAAAAKSLQSYPTLCDPIDGSPPGSPIPGILQARTLEWVAISLSNAWKWKVKGKSLSRVRLFATPWTAAHQASPSMGFSRQERRSGLPLPSPSEIATNSKMIYSYDPHLSHSLNGTDSYRIKQPFKITVSSFPFLLF